MHAISIIAAFLFWRSVSLADLQRFPPPRCVQQVIEFQASIDYCIEHRLCLVRSDDWAVKWAIQKYMTHSRYAWNTLRNAQNVDCSLSWRLGELLDLRWRLGEAWYAMGWMPEPVPWWYFPERD